MKEVVQAVALEHILLETDAPYLTPVPYRGQENQPAYVKFVAGEIAKLRRITLEEVIRITAQTSELIFKI